MRTNTILIFCVIAIQTVPVHSWGYSLKSIENGVKSSEDYVTKLAKKGSESIKNKAEKVKNLITSKIPVFLYYWPSRIASATFFGIKEMSITCNNQTFNLISDAVALPEYSQLFTRLDVVLKKIQPLNSYQMQKNASEGLYFNFSFDSKQNALVVTTSDDFVALDIIGDIGTASLNLTSSKVPKKITFAVNGKKKTFNINSRLYVVPWIR